MISALMSFLGGSIFRMIWGEVSNYLSARQDHTFEIARMRLQGELDGAQHTRNQDAIRVQAELGVQTIQVQAEAAVGEIEADGWFAAVRSAMKPTGIAWVDAWNGIIRPAAATIAILLWVLALNQQGWRMGLWDMELVGVVLGFFFASREFTKRGK